jgi:hypothetical protein
VIAAAHIPVVVGLTLYLNFRTLPEGLRPNVARTAGMVVAGAFYAVFATVHVATLVS